MSDAGLLKIFMPCDTSGEIREKKPKKFVIWLLAGAIVFLAISSFTGGNSGTKNSMEKEETEIFSVGEYIDSTEKRLAEILGKINGVGEVSVFITIESGNEKILASDLMSRNNTEEREGVDYLEENESEKNVVMRDAGTEQKPFVIKEKFPVPTGVLVVAEGAENEVVREEIYEAVQAIFGLSPYRIKITY